MKRCENRALLKLSHNLICYELTAYELLSTVNNPMSNSLNILKT